MGPDPLLFLVIVAAAAMAAAGGIWFLSRTPTRAGRSRGFPLLQHDGTAFLFDGDALVDATPGGRTLLARTLASGGMPWTRLVAWLAPRFPDAAAQIATVAQRGRIAVPSSAGVDPPLVLTAEHYGGLTRIVVSGLDGTEHLHLDPLAEQAMVEELDQQRAISDAMPVPAWMTDGKGEVVWANGAYLRLATERLAHGTDISWPLPALFPGPLETRSAARRHLAGAHGRPDLWFEVHCQTVTPRQDGPAFSVCHAIPADALVQAETSLQSFMQTLARTFAHLPTGLAIFDQQRRLALYNPALVDLTSLPPEFLSGRPQLPVVLDALRERNMLPEPRDWRRWRRGLSEIEAANADHFEETWSLASGQTYRVTCRPHPNGALAMMIDDISSEVGQSRRYRADLELGQAVIDAMDEAIAVFSSTGTLVLSNVAYAELWGHDPGGVLDNDATISAFAGYWRSRTAPTQVWDRAETFALTLSARDGWAEEVRLTDGRLLSIRFERLAGGATLAGFRAQALPTGGAAPVFASVRQSA